MNLHPYQRRVFALFCALTLCLMCSVTAQATDDPLTVVNNLSSFIFSLIKAIGMIILAFGIVQVGLSLKSHDASQRATGFLTSFPTSSPWRAALSSALPWRFSI